MADVENNNEKSQLKGGDSASSAATESADNFRSEIWSDQTSRINSSSDQSSRTNGASDQTGRANSASDQTGRTNGAVDEPIRTKSGDNKGKDQAHGDAYASNTARGDAYPSNTARGDAYPSDTARGDAYPMPSLTIDNQKEGRDPVGGKFDKEAGDKSNEGKEPGDKKRDQYDPFFQNENMLQSMMQPLDAPQGGDRTEVVGNDSYRFDENGHETYQNGQGQIVTNPDGTFSVEGNVASWTQSKDGYNQTIIFNDGSRVYMAGGRIRAVSSERENGRTPYSRYREIHRSNYK